MSRPPVLRRSVVLPRRGLAPYPGLPVQEQSYVTRLTNRPSSHRTDSENQYKGSDSQSCVALSLAGGTSGGEASQEFFVCVLNHYARLEAVRHTGYASVIDVFKDALRSDQLAAVRADEGF